jgi:hypoxanthine phosphoribosyltransferase
MNKRKDSRSQSTGPDRKSGAAQPLETLYGADAIQDRIGAAGRHFLGLDADDPLVVSLLSGSVHFLIDLLRSIGSDLRYEFIHVESTEGEGDGIKELHYPIPFQVRDADIILLRDVTATGVIENYLVDQLEQQGAQRVRTISLVNVPARRTTEFEAEYSLFTAPPEVQRLVGYGLKYRGRYGNLPYIGQLS